jgi:RNA polymerase sigma-70 factor (ECF subfamily)
VLATTSGRGTGWRQLGPSHARVESGPQRSAKAARILAETDAELVRRAQAGDREAFGSLVIRYAGMVRRLTRAVLHDTADADDAAQDAFLRAWMAVDRFKSDQPLTPWLVRIALNAARDLARRRKVRSTEQLDATLTDWHPAPDTATHEALLEGRLRTALAGLPERQRTALVLFEVEGYAHAEIGALLGVPEGTVRSDVFHARRRLRAALGDREED